MIPTEIDVAVLGGSIAGCSTAIRMKQLGHHVVIFEKKAVVDSTYKALCTHFVQPSAVPLLGSLGLEYLTGSDYSVRTKARFITPGGVIDTPGDGYTSDDDNSYALNLERRVLDPALRAAVENDGIAFEQGTTIERLEREGRSGPWHLETVGDSGARQWSARLVVAADGRQSWTAKHLENPTTTHVNERAARFGHFSGIETPTGNRSIFAHHEREMAFLYPLPAGRTLLSLYIEKSRLVEWRREKDANTTDFLRHSAAMLGIPSIASASTDGKLHGFGDYPSLIRRPVWDSVPFVGDASMSLDPMSGVGCGFALQSSALLAQAFEGRSLDDVEGGLAAYEQLQHSTIFPHAAGICADSVVGKNPVAQQRMFRTISNDDHLSGEYLRLTGRMIRPKDFQRTLMRAMVKQRDTQVAPVPVLSSTDPATRMIENVDC